MKFRFSIPVVLICLGIFWAAHAGKHRFYRQLPRTEGEMVTRLLECLRNQDTVGYYNLFPPFDTLWHFVMHNPDHTPGTVAELEMLKEHPRVLVEFDPYYNPSIMEHFCFVLKKGADSGLHWGSLVLARYQLQKEPMRRELIGYEKVVPERFMGYLFVREISGHSTYCIAVAEIQKFNGYFVGGQVINVMEASTVEEYEARLEFEKNYIFKLRTEEEDSSAAAIKRDSLYLDSVKKGWIVLPPVDSAKLKDSVARAKKGALLNGAFTDEDTQKVRREVVDRKYYEGKFDDEIPVELFIRYMRDVGTGTVGSYDALYKFGDQVKYVRLDVTKTGEKWEFDDDPPVGSMELVLKNRIYTGTWTNNESKSGYDAVLKEVPIAPRKLEMLDKILEKGLSGRSDEESQEDNKKDKKREKRKSRRESDDE